MAVEPRIVFSGDATGVMAVINRLKTEMKSLDSIASKAMSFGIGTATVAAGVAAMVAMTKAAIDQGDALSKMSQKTGMAVEDLSKLQYAADLSGVSSEALQKGITALSASMAEAAGGAGPMAEAFKKLGISVRNNDGTMKTSGAVLAEFADQFKAMPDGVDQANLAADIFGKKLGSEMIPLLNSGSAGLKAMGDEAEALGLVMSTELAKRSEEFNDNLDRMSKMVGVVGKDIANSLIPALNVYMMQLIDARKANMSFTESLVGIGLSNPFKNTKEQIASLSSEIEKLKARSDPLGQVLSKNFGKSTGIDQQIAGLEKLKKYYELQQERETGDGIASAKEIAAQRLGIERQLQTKMVELARLRAIAEGKVSADILDTDSKRVDAQIKNAEKLRDALSTAWKQSLTDAQAAGEAAKALFTQAGDVRQTGADKASAKLRSTLTPEQQQAEIKNEVDSAASAAETSAGLATIAALHGRLESAAKLTKQASKDAERAAKFADQIDDPMAGSQAITQAAELQAKVLEAQAKTKQGEQKGLEERAAAQATLINGLDQQITDLQAKAAAIKVDADISAAQGALVTLQGQLDALKDKTITVTINQVGSTDAPLAGASPASGTGGAFARGGYTGHGSKYQPAGIVHAGEVVHRSEVVRQPGALPFLLRFNQVGMAAIKELRGYANGGLVNNLNIAPLKAPSAAAGGNGNSGGTAIFNIGDMGKFPLTATPDVMSSLKTAFAREALKKGGRR